MRWTWIVPRPFSSGITRALHGTEKGASSSWVEFWFPSVVDTMDPLSVTKAAFAASLFCVMSSQHGKFWGPLHRLIRSGRRECDSRRLRNRVIFTQPLALRWAYSAGSWARKVLCVACSGARATDSPSQHFHGYTDADFNAMRISNSLQQQKKSTLLSAVDQAVNCLTVLTVSPSYPGIDGVGGTLQLLHIHQSCSKSRALILSQVILVFLLTALLTLTVTTAEEINVSTRSSCYGQLA